VAGVGQALGLEPRLGGGGGVVEVRRGQVEPEVGHGDGEWLCYVQCGREVSE
jgi:hypothetical protein